MKVQVLTPEQVRAVVDSRDTTGEPNLADRVAKELGISRRLMFYYLRRGVTIDVPPQTKALLDAAGVEVTTKRSKK